MKHKSHKLLIVLVTLLALAGLTFAVVRSQSEPPIPSPPPSATKTDTPVPKPSYKYKKLVSTETKLISKTGDSRTYDFSCRYEVDKDTYIDEYKGRFTSSQSEELQLVEDQKKC